MTFNADGLKFSWVPASLPRERGLLSRLFASWVRWVEETTQGVRLHTTQLYGSALSLPPLKEMLEHEALAEFTVVGRDWDVTTRELQEAVLVSDEHRTSTVALWISREGESFEIRAATCWAGGGIPPALSRIADLLASVRKTRSEERAEVAMLQATPRGWVCQAVGSVASILERSNYEDAVVQAFDAIVEEYRKPEPAGRLVLVEGPPGTGKTRFVRGLMGACGLPVLLLPAKDIGMLEQASALSSLRQWVVEARIVESRRGALVVVEDADSLLVPRQSDNISALSALLNMSDGILGDVANLRIVVTTNAKKGEVDSAILREGRLLRHVRIGLLSPDQALSIVRRENPDLPIDMAAMVPYSSFSLARCYAIARGSVGWR